MPAASLIALAIAMAVSSPEEMPELVPLKVIRTEIIPRAIAAEGSGAVWARDAQERLLRFDGRRWQVVESPARRPHALVPGARGLMLVGSGEEATIYRGGKQVASGPVLSVIENHRKLLAGAYRPRNPLQPADTPLMLVGGPDGLLWVLSQHSLRLLDGDRWHDAYDALMKAGSRHGSISYLAPVGDGRVVYVSDLALRHDGGTSFLVSLKDGKLHTTAAPHSIMQLGGQQHRDVRGPEGRLWIQGTQGRALSTSDWFSGQLAIRLGEEGIAGEWVNSGWARLADGAGNVWFSDIRGESPEQVNVWRDGEIAQRLKIPGRLPHGMILSDTPGSVYVRTTDGLQHLTAEAPDYREHRLAHRYRIAEVAQSARIQAYSRRGYLVVTSLSPTPRPAEYLYLVRLPRRPQAGRTDQ